MGDIKLINLEDAKNSALQYLSNLGTIDTEEKLYFVIIVFMQLINCIIYKVEADVAKLTTKSIESRCKSIEIKSLFMFRNTICHLYGTEVFNAQLKLIVSLFGDNYPNTILSFIKEVVSSINDNTFMGKYGVPEKEKFSSLKSLI